MVAAEEWRSAAEVSAGIRRVVLGDRTAWFLPAGDVSDLTCLWPVSGPDALAESRALLTAPEASAGTAELAGRPMAGWGDGQDPAGVCVDGQAVHVLGCPPVRGAAGMLVPRFHGGLLIDALRGYGGLSAGQVLTVLGSCLEALSAAPPPGHGRVRCHREAFAVDQSGCIGLIPGHSAPADERTAECRELGELAYLALTGMTWQERALPVPDVRPAPPPELAAVIVELLEADAETPLKPEVLLSRLGRVGQPAEIPFVPAEAEVSVSEAVTAQLRVDARTVRALSEEYSSLRSRRSAREHSAGTAAPAAEERGAGASAEGAEDSGAVASGEPARTRAAAALSAVFSAPAAVPERDGQPGVAQLRRAAGQAAGRAHSRRSAVRRSRGSDETDRHRTGSRVRSRTDRSASRVRSRSGRSADRVLGQEARAGSSARVVRTGRRGLRLALTRQTLLGGTLALLVSALGVAVLTGLLNLGSIARDRVASADTSAPATAPATDTAPSRNPGERADEETDTSAADPAAAFTALTAAREAAYSAGDGRALATLTVPGSPASEADASADVTAFTGHDVTIELSEMRIEQTGEETALLRVRTHATSRSPDGTLRDHGSELVDVELRRESGQWRVYDVVSAA